MRSRPLATWLLIAMPAALGLGLMIGSLSESSATYDEVAYMKVAAARYRGGSQEAITRMGSPAGFWKFQQYPAFLVLDACGKSAWVDDPIAHQAKLLPIVRLSSLWIWLCGFAVTVCWSRSMYGAGAAIAAAWLYALSPNLLAHGSLVTMESPAVATLGLASFLFWRFLNEKKPLRLVVAGAALGLAFTCKFTAAAFALVFAGSWWIDELKERHRPGRSILRVVAGMAGLVAVMLAADFAFTGFDLTPLSERRLAHPSLGSGPAKLLGPLLEIPLPRDWVGFANQMKHQAHGGPSYLCGERRMKGWSYYYLIALAVKTPLAVGFLAALRGWFARRLKRENKSDFPPILVALFLLLVSVGSSRNYGVRYLLPVAPAAIVWISGLARAGTAARVLLAAGVAGMGIATASIHPYELSYFNALAGGPAGGKRILADSNLDWGQGLKGLAKLQRERPEFRDLTLFYFGDTPPRYYGVIGEAYVVGAAGPPPEMPATLGAKTRFIAVSRSLQFGPWGPLGYFRRLDRLDPVAVLPDETIAIYQTP